MPIATFTVPIVNDGAADGVKTVKLQIAQPAADRLHRLAERSGAQITAELHIRRRRADGGLRPAPTSRSTRAPAWRPSPSSAPAAWPAWCHGGLRDHRRHRRHGRDYTTVSGTVTFAAGQDVATVLVPVIDNTTVADDKSLVLTLSNVQRRRDSVRPRSVATLTIKDDDKAGVIAFAGASFIVSGDGRPAVITVVRTNGTAGCPLPLTVPTPAGGSCAEPTLVTFSTSDNTALAGSDYTAVSTVVEFGAGETEKTVLVPIVSDGPGEGTELVNLTLTNPLPAGATLVGRAPVLGSRPRHCRFWRRSSASAPPRTRSGEGGGPAIITVVRVGDLSGPATLDLRHGRWHGGVHAVGLTSPR
jgi:hypothetical protein